MQNKKSAHPDTAMSERAVETGPVSQTAPHLHQQSTTAPTPGQALHVADFLSRGADHAVSLRRLRELIHLPARTVRLMIRSERLAGTPILESSNPLCGGYYLPGTSDERMRCVRRLRKRAMEIERTADAIEGAAGID